MKTIFFACMLISAIAAAQDLPYRELSAPPENYSAGAVAARLVDGLGFRFYWATDGLRPQDLAFKPGNDTRTSEETIAHIYGMSFLIMNAAKGVPNASGQDVKLPFAEMRKKTLTNLKEAADILRKTSDEDLKKCEFVFPRGNEEVRRPFWLMINGPISDCLWHVGQVVTFRRSSGNPFTDKVSVFTGTIIK